MKLMPLFLLSLLPLSLHAFDVEQKRDPALYVHEIESAHFRFYSNHNVDDKSQTIKRLVFAIQGNKRDAASRMRIMQRLVDEMAIDHETLIISPCFKTNADALLPNEPYWKNAGWKQGDRSKDESRISSFVVLDKLIERVVESGNFPALRHVVVSGHSAGGQVTHRYAITSTITAQYPMLQFTFMVMNPSSYTYLNVERPVSFSPAQIPGFDRYKYGLSNRNAYSSSRTKGDLCKAYLERHVVYALGQADCDPSAEDLDLREEAMLQGSQRLSRGQNYFRHIDTLANHHHQLIEIPDVGHDAEAMYAAESIRRIVFQ